MAKYRIYDTHEALEVLGAADRAKRPRKFIWVHTKQGPVKFLSPVAYFGPGLEYGIRGDVKVAPRYQVTIRNCP